jgi:hypothetical protein
MRNRRLHDALRDFALESAALLTEDLGAGAEVDFDVIDEGGRRGPALYRYRPRTEAFIAERWALLRDLPACRRAAEELGAGAALWLRVNGLRGEQAEPALQALLVRLYEDATSFGFPEERFERVYREVEATLYRDTVRVRVLAPLCGAAIEAERIELGGGLSLVRGELADAPAEAVRSDEDSKPALLCVLERDASASASIPVADAAERFAGVVTALRLWAPGLVSLGAPGWRRIDDGPWQAVSLGARPRSPGVTSWLLPRGEEPAFRDFFAALPEADLPQTVAWALGRFEMGCERGRDDEALSDYLLALRALLDATSDAGQASLALRVAALCAEEGTRKHVQRRTDDAIALERFVMGGGPGRRHRGDSPRELVAELEGNLRALLRDVMCGYLGPDLKALADDILLESTPEPYMEIKARRLEPTAEPDPREPEQETSELEAVTLEGGPAAQTLEAEPVAPATRHQLDGVTPSSEWEPDDPEDYSAPV